jgi:hypothetical protein
MHLDMDMDMEATPACHSSEVLGLGHRLRMSALTTLCSGGLSAGCGGREGKVLCRCLFGWDEEKIAM